MQVFPTVAYGALQIPEAVVDPMVVGEGRGQAVAEGSVGLEVPLVVELVSGGPAREVRVLDGVLLEVPPEMAASTAFRKKISVLYGFTSPSFSACVASPYARGGGFW